MDSSPNENDFRNASSDPLSDLTSDTNHYSESHSEGRSTTTRTNPIPSDLASTIASSPFAESTTNPGSESSLHGLESETNNFDLGSSPDASQFRGGASYDDDQASRLDSSNPADEIRRAALAGIEGIPRVADVVGDKVQEQFEQFMLNYTDDEGKHFYLAQIRKMKSYNLSTLFVDWTHLEGLSLDQGEEGSALAIAIKKQYFRFLPFLQRALKNVIRRIDPTLLYESGNLPPDDDTLSQTASHISAPTVPSTGQSSSSAAENNERIFQVSFYDLPSRSRLRDLRADAIGSLLCFTGTVTRTSEVRPELYKATFRCDACGTEAFGIEQAFKYTTPYMCSNPTCQNRNAWTLIPTRCQFMDWQRVRVQENPGDIPTGSMPRTIDVILRGDMVDRAKAGDRCLFTGTEIVIPDVSQLGLPGVKPMAMRDRRDQGRSAGLDGAVSGLKSLGARDLTYKLAFVACMAQPDQEDSNAMLQELRNAGIPDTIDMSDINAEQEAYLDTLDNDETEDLRQMVQSENSYEKLVNSIAPAVFGHEAIKKGILLQLLGGVHKTTPEGIQLRGDINVCIVGDPSTSKSQFLKYVTGLLPRSVYTSGKASSAAGLTAAVVKDEESSEHTIEAGALMLADNGICAIDEFDKMDLGDQVAIHEAMEQQTISIAKAGIQATLNARTSILAAANPVGGRYNTRKSLKTNVNMSAPIMSRFDLFFVVLDQCNTNTDKNLAEHIVGLHMNGDDAIDPPFSSKQLLRYITYAKLFKPKFTEGAKNLLISRYQSLRANDFDSGRANPTSGAHGGSASNTGKSSFRITVRQLESLIRLSEAIARAHCVNVISEPFVQEAYNLLRASIVKVDQEDVDIGDNQTTFPAPHIDRSSQTDSLTARLARSEENTNSSAGRPTNRISAERYNKLVNELVEIIEDATTEVVEDANGDNVRIPIDTDGVDVLQLENWYLEQVEGDIHTVDQVDREKSFIRKILKRMVKDHVIMELRGDIDDMDDESRQSVKYVLHPNYSNA